MYCSHCGALLEDDARFCSQCGRTVPQPEPEPESEPRDPNETIADEPSPVIRYEPSSDRGAPAPGNRAPKARRNRGESASSPGAKNYLVPAILAAVFCCQPFGIVAIVYAIQANGKTQSGDAAGARRARESASKWLTWAIVLGLLVYAVGIILNLLGVPVLGAA